MTPLKNLLLASMVICGLVSAPAAQPAAPYQDKFVTVHGHRIHYLDWGTAGKQPFIMIHGIFRVAHSFDHIAPQFTRDHHVIAVDMRGHGDSDWDSDGAYQVDDYVEDLDGLVTQLDLQDIILLGNSTGGRVAQVYAGKHPERISALIVEDVGPERPNEIASNLVKRVAQEEKGWASEEELLTYLRQSGGARIPEELQRSYIRYGTKRREDGRLVWKRDPNVTKGFVPVDLWPFVRKITARTFYILGGASTIVPPDTQRQLKATIPGCEIVVMPGIGHYPHLEAAPEYVAIVKKFLQGAPR